jgi:hypothetical protein
MVDSRLRQFDNFHKTRSGFLIAGLVELGLAYLFASLAINSGSLWEYFLVIVLVIGTLQNFVRLFIKIVASR